MARLDELRDGLGRAWDNLTEGWRQLRERADHALTRFRSGRDSGSLETGFERFAEAAPSWAVLPVEVSEHGDSLEIRLEVPGMEPDAFDVYVQGDYLVISGEKQVERDAAQGRYYVMERAYGRFERAVPLPAAVDESRATARYKRGVLRITLPIRDRGAHKRVTVKSG